MAGPRCGAGHGPLKQEPIGKTAANHRAGADVAPVHEHAAGVSVRAGGRRPFRVIRRTARDRSQEHSLPFPIACTRCGIAQRV